MRFLLEDAECAGTPPSFGARGDPPHARSRLAPPPAGRFRSKLGQRSTRGRRGAPPCCRGPGSPRAGTCAPSLVSLTPLSKPGALELRTVNVSNPTPDPIRPACDTAVAERQGDHAVRHAGEDPDGKLERAARIIETDHILARKTERLGGLRAHERGVVPRELGEGIGKLLQPPVVREAAVVKRRGGEEHDLQAQLAEPPARSRAGASSAKGSAVRVGTTSGSSLPESNPSCKTRFHFLSNSASPRIGFQVSRTMS